MDAPTLLPTTSRPTAVQMFAEYQWLRGAHMTWIDFQNHYPEIEAAARDPHAYWRVRVTIDPDEYVTTEGEVIAYPPYTCDRVCVLIDARTDRLTFAYPDAHGTPLPVDIPLDGHYTGDARTGFAVLSPTDHACVIIEPHPGTSSAEA